MAKKEASPTLEGHTVCPGALGTTNFMAPAYDPQTSLFYVTARDQCDIFQHRSAALRGWPCLLRQRIFSFGRGRALSRISEGDRPRDRRDQVEVRAHVADLVGRACRPPAAWCSLAMRKETSSLSTRRRASRCGTSRWAAQSMPRPSPSRWTAKNTWRSLRAAPSMRLDCLRQPTFRNVDELNPG